MDRHTFTFTLSAYLDSLINLTYMPLGCGRDSEYPERTERPQNSQWIQTQDPADVAPKAVG